MFSPDIQKHIMEYIPRDRDMKSDSAYEMNEIIYSFHNPKKLCLLYPYKCLEEKCIYQYHNSFYLYALRYNNFNKSVVKQGPCDGP